MAGNPKIQIDILADGSDAKKELDKTSKAFDKFGKGLDKASGWAAGGGVALVGLGAMAVDAAADMERAATTVDRLYADGGATLKTYAKDAASSVGVSTAAYLDMAAKLGPALQSTGQDTKTMAVSADEMITLAGDMALAMGTDVPTALDAMGAGMRGETDALGEFGVNIDTANIQQELLAQGITGPDGLAPAIGSAEYNQQLLNDILGGVGGIYGGYRTETDTTAESTQKMWAEFDNAKVKLGEGLLPILSTVAEKLTDFAGFVSDNSDAIMAWLPWLAGAAGAVWVLNWALAANPIILWTTAILIAVGAAIYFREAIGDWLWNALNNLNNLMMSSDWWNSPFQEALKPLGLDAESFATTINNINSAMSGLWDWFSKNWTFTLPVIGIPEIPGLPGSFAVPGGATPTGRSLAATGPTVAAGAGGPNITIQVGVGDPDAIARAVQRVLTGRARRVGAVNI